MQVAPVVLVPWVLTQDGPAHVAGAWVLVHHGDEGPVGAALREHYVIDLTPVPNMLTTLLLAGLLHVVGPDVAEKVVLAGFVLVLAAGLRYALRGIDRRAGWLAVVALPLAGAELVAYGFYNFCWGVALSLFVIGLALRRRDGWWPRHVVGLSLLLLVTWSAHLLPWLVAVGVVGALGLGRAACLHRGGLGWYRAVRGQLGGPVLAGVPTALLSAWYAAGDSGEPGEPAGGPSWTRLGRLLSLYRPLVVGSRLELVPAVLVAVTMLVLLLVAVRRPAASAGEPPSQRDLRGADRVVLGLAAGGSAVAFLLSPSRLGDDFGFLPERLAWFPLLLLTLFCATRMPGRPAARQLAAGLVVVAATTAVLVRLPTQLADQRQAAELMSVATELPPGTTFAVLRFSGHEAVLAPVEGEPIPLRHLSSRLAVEVGGVDVGHYEAVYPYFQVRFSASPAVRQAIDPGLDGLEGVPPSVDLLAAGRHLDHVLVVGLEQAEDWVRESQRTARVLADLRAGYELVGVSEPSGYVSVWRLQAATDG